jgi:hypothetical protein
MALESTLAEESADQEFGEWVRFDHCWYFYGWRLL